MLIKQIQKVLILDFLTLLTNQPQPNKSQQTIDNNQLNSDFIITVMRHEVIKQPR